MIKYSKIILLLVFLLSFCGNSIAQEIRIGVLAISGVEKAKIAWQPTIDFLNKNITEHSFQLISIEPGDMHQLELKVKNDEIQFVITPPALYVDLENLYGVIAILTLVDKSKQSMFGSTLIVRSDNKTINDFKDVKNISIAAVAKKGFAGWLIGHKLFIDNGINLYEDSKGVSFLGTQPKVVKSIISGKHDLGIIRTGMLEKLAAAGEINRDDLRIFNQQHSTSYPYILSSKLYPEWAFAKTAKTPRKLTKQVAKTLLSLPPGDKIALAGGYWEWTTSANYQPVHELMKKLHVGSYSEYGKVTTYDYIVQHKIKVFLFSIFIIGILLFSILIRKANKKLCIEQHAKNEALERLKVLASHDGLTGLPNRRLMLELLEKDIAYASRNREKIAVMFIDLDGFKQVNDTLGHDIGDKVLVETANAISNYLRKSDICSRIGGDEFIVTVKGLKGDDDKSVKTIAEKLIQQISNINIMGTNSVLINACIGIVVLVPYNETTPEKLIKIADNMMYKAKSKGKGQYVIEQVKTESQTKFPPIKQTN